MRIAKTRLFPHSRQKSIGYSFVPRCHILQPSPPYLHGFGKFNCPREKRFLAGIALGDQFPQRIGSCLRIPTQKALDKTCLFRHDNNSVTLA